MKRGIESWQVAFEAAGFIKGIVADEAPKNDPDWSPEDARYSVMRWFPSTMENATGPNVNDPRTGEILESDIYMYHNIMNLQRSWYFTQVGHLDPRRAHVAVPGFTHGAAGGVRRRARGGAHVRLPARPEGELDLSRRLRASRTWVNRMGHSPSIMDYSRFNYTAQPSDNIPLEDLIPRIGPWDKYTTHWGYAPIPGATTPDAEWATLDSWSRQQDATPWFRFNMSDSRGADPGDHTEAVGDGDAVKATGWGMQSIKQIVPLLVPAAVHNGESYDDLEELYGRLIGQWTNELSHVANVVGGAKAQEKYAGQTGPRYVAK